MALYGGFKYGGEEYFSDTWHVANGIYSQSDTSAITHMVVWNHSSYEDWQDPDMTFRLRKGSGHTIGAVFRYNKTTELGYCIRFKDASKVELGTYDNDADSFSQISEHDLAIPLNVWVYWRIVIKSNTILLLYSDDNYDWQKIFSATDTTYPNAGRVGFITFSTDADYDDFLIGECSNVEVGF